MIPAISLNIQWVFLYIGNSVKGDSRVFPSVLGTTELWLSSLTFFSLLNSCFRSESTSATSLEYEPNIIKWCRYNKNDIGRNTESCTFHKFSIHKMHWFPQRNHCRNNKKLPQCLWARSHMLYLDQQTQSILRSFIFLMLYFRKYLICIINHNYLAIKATIWKEEAAQY